MKLIVTYKVNGNIYRVNINSSEFNVYNELNKILETICEKFNVEEYSVTKVKEEIQLDKVTPEIVNAINRSSDFRFSEDEKLNFIVKTIFNTQIGLVISRLMNSTLSKEEEVIKVTDPCHNKLPKMSIIYYAIDENRNIVAKGSTKEEIDEIMKKKGYEKGTYDIITVIDD